MTTSATLRDAGLHVVRASGAAILAAELVRRWAQAPADPFMADLVVVPGAGMRRWLGQRIAVAAGVCAGVEFRTPFALEEELLGDDPAWWVPERAAWTLQAVLDEDASPVFDRLRAHVAAAREPYTVLRRVAARFVRYAEFRPDMVSAWRAGADVDDAGGELGDDAWQARLWRGLRDATGGDPAEAYERA